MITVYSYIVDDRIRMALYPMEEIKDWHSPVNRPYKFRVVYKESYGKWCCSCLGSDAYFPIKFPIYEGVNMCAGDEFNNIDSALRWLLEGE